MPLTISLTPGKQFAVGEKANREALNLLGQGSVVLDGAVDSSQIDAEAVNSTHLRVEAYFYGEEAVGSDDIVITLDPPLRALEAGTQISFKAASSKTAAATLNVNGLGAKPVLKRGGVSLRTGDIKSGQVVEVQYVISALYNGGLGAWTLQSLEGNEVENYVVSSGTGTDYVMTYSPVLLALYNGLRIGFRAHTANMGACTANPNALGAKAIRKYGNQALAASDIQQNQAVELIYDSTTDTFLMISPPAAELSTKVFSQGVPTGNALAGTDVSVGAVSLPLTAGKSWRYIRIGFATLLRSDLGAGNSIRNITCKIGADLLALVNTAPPASVQVDNSDDNLQVSAMFEGAVPAGHAADNPLAVTVYAQTAGVPDDTAQRVLYGVGECI